MNLQFGCDKCEKLNVWKTENPDICPPTTLNSWKEKVVDIENCEKILDVKLEKNYMRDLKVKEIY